MKDKSDRRHRRSWRLALVAPLLPLALSSAAQTPAAWPAASQPDPAKVVTVATTSATVPAAAPALPERSAAASHLHSLPLASDFDVREFEAVAQAIVAEHRVPGMAMALVKDGRVLSARGYGVTSVSDPQPVGAHTVFRLASLSKAFAATMTGLLVSEGALRWDSKVTDYIPGFRLQEPGAAQRVTVADVLSHRVGLTHNTYDRDLEANVDYRTLTQRLAYAPMACEPGECYAYQNIAFSLIGDVVYAATGNFYSQAVERRIFKPLGMNDASYGLEGIESSPSWAHPHVHGRRGWVALTPKPSYYRIAPAAGVNASISDMAQWLVAQSGHRPDVLPAPLLATLHAPLVSTPSELHGSSWRRTRLDTASYALGWRIYDYDGHPLVFHGGAVQGYRGLIAMLPDHDLGVVILWNGESSVPSALLPTIIDRALDLPAHRWLDDDIEPDMLYARGREPDEPAGVDASRSTAAPK